MQITENANKGGNCKTKTRPGILWLERARSNCARQLMEAMSKPHFTFSPLLRVPPKTLISVEILYLVQISKFSYSPLLRLSKSSWTYYTGAKRWRVWRNPIPSATILLVAILMEFFVTCCVFCSIFLLHTV